MKKIALAGNPNVGKSSIFNHLTGDHRHVGNWAGKTVEKKSGKFIQDNEAYSIVDLPGTYSLHPYSEEEIIAHDYIHNKKADYVIQVIDASNIERNLYLTLQLMEHGINLVIALNMNDLAEEYGIHVDEERLARHLKVPVVKVNAKKKEGLSVLIEKTISNKIRYDAKEYEKLDENKRYKIIEKIIKDTKSKKEIQKKVTETLDRITTSNIIGIPIFLLMMFLAFTVTFYVAEPISAGIDHLLTNIIGGLLGSFLNSIGAPDIVISFMIDGIIHGVGSVMVFVPFIMMLFLLISLLEESGYMSRAAYVMEKFMHKMGLPGKAFLPMILGFGCSVPAIMATRTLENKKDRILTMLVIPFISCGAKLPVYVLFAAAIFPKHANFVIFGLYVFGIIIALLSAFILKKTILKKEDSPFLLEMTSFRIPCIKESLRSMWRHGYHFLKKAGTVIFFFVIIIWLLASFPQGAGYAGEDSIIGKIGSTISPVFAPLGFDSWQTSVSIVFGLMAKEVVISTMGTVYGTGEETTSLISAIQSNFSPLSAISFIIFVLLYAPCISAIATIKQEAGWKWAGFATIYTTGIAWIVSFIIYNIGIIFF